MQQAEGLAANDGMILVADVGARRLVSIDAQSTRATTVVHDAPIGRPDGGQIPFSFCSIAAHPLGGFIVGCNGDGSIRWLRREPSRGSCGDCYRHPHSFAVGAQVLLADKVAIVSGAGPGLGRSICVRFAGHGAKVVIGDLDEHALADSIAAVHAAGGQASGRITDITSRGDCDALVRHALDEFGSLDILVNDAYHGGDFSRFEDADLTTLVMICTHGVDVIQPTFGAYTGSKAALAHLTKLLAAELGTQGIRVNAVFPGPIWGANLRGYLDAQADARGVAAQAVYDEFAAKNAMHALVLPDEIADSVVFLASDMARPITGQALYANAGESFH
ncbi:MAG: SDR family oxidoreductase [Actinobacteria bacterium]|nr:MAG: SDR family oxidoreductase [Actinomycetota bacterium]